MSGYPQYALDWHQCHACGCTYPKRMLRTVIKTDPVLKLTGPVFECVDGAQCDRFKLQRAEHLKLARERVLAQIAANQKRRGT